MRGRAGADGEARAAEDGWAAVVRDASALLERDGRLAVSGPWGAGKSTLLDALAERASAAQGSPAARRCLRVRTQEGDEEVAYGALVQLLSAADAAADDVRRAGLGDRGASRAGAGGAGAEVAGRLGPEGGLGGGPGTSQADLRDLAQGLPDPVPLPHVDPPTGEGTSSASPAVPTPPDGPGTHATAPATPRPVPPPRLTPATVHASTSSTARSTVRAHATARDLAQLTGHARHDGGAADDPLRLRLALTRLLDQGPPVLLVIDGAQWVDPASASLIGYAVRTLPPARLTVVAAERTSGRPAAAAALLGGHPAVLPVAPADLAETAAACARLGLPARWAAPVHRHCGGHRALLDAWLTSLPTAATRPGDTDAGPGPPAPPRQVRDLAAAWLGSVPADVRTTLQVAALAGTCDADLLRHSGRRAAEDHLAHALDAGLLAADDIAHHAPAGAALPGTAPPHRFAATALADAATATAPRERRTAIHRALAASSHDPVARALHTALAQESPDRAVAEDTARAADAARAAGQRPRAAELLFLAARLTPADRPHLRLDRLAEAAQEAAAAGSATLTRLAADRIVAEHGTPAQQVHALLAVVDAHGQDTAGTRPLLATARRTAADDPALLSAVELRTAVQENIAGEDYARALHHAQAATALAEQSRAVPLVAASLTMTARMQRVLGCLDAASATLERALSLAVPPARSGIRNSPQYLAARHAVFDARLTEARTLLLPLVPVAEKSGEAEDLVDLWRSLAEVDAGRGACGQALHWSARAVDLTAAAGLSPGPAWYTAALAQTCGGTFARALSLAAHGVRASREERDALHTARGLWVLGAALLHTGRVEDAAGTLAEVADLESRSGAADPALLRWQGDAVEAYALSGRTEQARDLLERMQEQVGPHPAHAAPRAALTRARGLCRHLDGAGDEAAELLADAAGVFAGLGLPVEEGRTHLLRGRVERRRRRAAAARSAWEAARTLFESAQARPWTALADDHLSHLTGRASAPSTPKGPAGPAAHGLTEHELRLARLVRAGATNQQAAQQMFISVKTVETVLSRIYRKLGIRSRTQLATALTAEGTARRSQ
ncbi:LuxR C-terminal-related transcriptional regulator [Streptomyces sp. NPDC047123]|uniref:helix-turn-helix transcriptional regulator n=1 Tax=Streptomyces sp. NPDC047123 TaxID=3155622 RepID=UPI0033FCD508